MTVENKNTPFADGHYFPRLSESQCQKIHGASLEILDRIGVRLFHGEAIDLLKKAGARVTDGNRVQVPPALVERALATAPKRVVLHDRHGNPTMHVEGYRCFYGPGSDCLNVIDHRTGERRKPRLDDIREGITLCESLPNIDFVMSLALPTDVNTAIADRYQMEIMLSQATKPIIFVTYDYEGCVDCIEMAEAVAGGEERLGQHPNVACYINVVSGLRHNKEGLQKLLFMAKKNLPVLYIPGSTAGMTSPSTPAGSLALDNAGSLLGIVLAQLQREGAPVIITGMPPGHLDMKTLVMPYSEPERGITQALVHFYDLPMFSYGGASDSKMVDQQAAAEAALCLMAETFGRGNIIHDLGYLESGLTFSLCQLALCDEIVDWIKAYSKNFEVTDETLALDVISQTGPDGEFLDTEHTLGHYKERWYPKLFERGTYEAWMGKGGLSLVERAAKRVELALGEPRSPLLPPEIRARLKEIVQRAEVRQKII
jgi:trimethylamine--corrinoid protein Co-methyltransferase